jgi:DNA-binding PadR family transcriptional regulator
MIANLHGQSRTSTRPEVKNPVNNSVSQGLVKEFSSWKPSKQNTFRVLVDVLGIDPRSKDLFAEDIALKKENYKRTGTDCSVPNISTETNLLVKEGYIVKKDNGFRKAKTYTFTELGRALARELIDPQNNDHHGNKKPLKNSKYIKNSSCSRERVGTFRDIKQYKRITFYGVILHQVQETLRLTTRGMANYLQFDDSSLRALLEKKDLHGKTKTKEAKEFCRVHMLLRGFFPDIDLVYRTWRKIDAENNGIRMTLFRLRQTYVDFKHVFLKNVSWYRKKGDSNLPFGDIFSKHFKEKKDCAQRKENQELFTIPGSQTTNEQRELAIRSLSWKIVRTDARSLRLVNV